MSFIITAFIFIVLVMIVFGGLLGDNSSNLPKGPDKRLNGKNRDNNKNNRNK